MSWRPPGEECDYPIEMSFGARRTTDPSTGEEKFFRFPIVKEKCHERAVRSKTVDGKIIRRCVKHPFDDKG